MDTEITNTMSDTREHHYVRVMVFGVVVGMISVSLFLLQPTSINQEGFIESVHKEATTTSPTQTFARSMPVHLRIPKINVDATFEAPLELNADQTVSVPEAYDTVGWYVHGATPGEVGPAVILGHVDSYQGPAVFYSLGKLVKGDRIEIDRADGTTAVFLVDELIRYSQDNFPTEDVYGVTETPSLRLVTCTGVFNKGKQRYSHNLVVYASLVKTP